MQNRVTVHHDLVDRPTVADALLRDLVVELGPRHEHHVDRPAGGERRLVVRAIDESQPGPQPVAPHERHDVRMNRNVQRGLGFGIPVQPRKTLPVRAPPVVGRLREAPRGALEPAHETVEVGGLVGVIADDRLTHVERRHRGKGQGGERAPPFAGQADEGGPPDRGDESRRRKELVEVPDSVEVPRSRHRVAQHRHDHPRQQQPKRPRRVRASSHPCSRPRRCPRPGAATSTPAWWPPTGWRDPDSSPDAGERPICDANALTCLPNRARVF